VQNTILNHDLKDLSMSDFLQDSLLEIDEEEDTNDFCEPFQALTAASSVNSLPLSNTKSSQWDHNWAQFLPNHFTKHGTC
jgi:hypothetical protein